MFIECWVELTWHYLDVWFSLWVCFEQLNTLFNSYIILFHFLFHSVDKLYFSRTLSISWKTVVTELFISCFSFSLWVIFIYVPFPIFNNLMACCPSSIVSRNLFTKDFKNCILFVLSFAYFLFVYWHFIYSVVFFSISRFFYFKKD